jgi:hypothetical protein
MQRDRLAHYYSDWGMGWMAEESLFSSIPGKGKRFLSSQQHSDKLSDPPSFLSMGTESCFAGGKGARVQANHSSPSIAKVKHV